MLQAHIILIISLPRLAPSNSCSSSPTIKPKSLVKTKSSTHLERGSKASQANIEKVQEFCMTVSQENKDKDDNSTKTPQTPFLHTLQTPRMLMRGRSHNQLTVGTIPTASSSGTVEGAGAKFVAWSLHFRVVFVSLWGTLHTQVFCHKFLI